MNKQKYYFKQLMISDLMSYLCIRDISPVVSHSQSSLENEIIDDDVDINKTLC